MRTPLSALAMVTCFAIGCGSDRATGPTGDRLSDNEFAAMMQALGAAGVFATDSLALFEGGPGARAMAGTQLASDLSHTTNGDFTVSCPLGGTLRVQTHSTLHTNDTTGETQITADVAYTLSACQAASDSGEVFTFGTGPDIQSAITISLSPNSAAVSGHTAGTFRWASDEKSGTCPMNLTSSFSATRAASTSTSTGTVCGRNINDVP